MGDIFVGKGYVEVFECVLGRGHCGYFREASKRLCTLECEQGGLTPIYIVIHDERRSKILICYSVTYNNI